MPQQPVEIILLRQWASYVATPVWIMGPDGSLLYYNEAAEPILGRPFDEAEEMPGERLSRMYHTAAPDGRPLTADQLPINIALTKRRPAHRQFKMKGLDGAWRLIEVTAFPIEGVGKRHLGAVAIFWESEDS
jgi:PAS domain-containing protein